MTFTVWPLLRMTTPVIVSVASQTSVAGGSGSVTASLRVHWLASTTGIVAGNVGFAVSRTVI